MDIEIVSPDTLAELDDGDTVFIIAMASHNETIKEQLLAMNIKKENIARAAVVIPHLAMELDIKNE